jgi:long-chain acyl-CoA synthetase
MLDLRKHESLGSALTEALACWPQETCLIEADRDRENGRWTYREFREISMTLAAALQSGGFSPGDRASILMTNQSKWLMGAYAVFYAGGVLVPLDYKLSPEEQAQLLAHSKARILIIEYHHWRALSTASPQMTIGAPETTIVTEAPAGTDLKGALRWEQAVAPSEAAPSFVERSRKDAACVVYSSGTGGRPKGCVLTHDNYLEQCTAVASMWPFSPGTRYLSILPTNHAIDFMGGFIMPFTGGGTVVHLRTLRPEYVKDAFTRYKITYVALVPMVLKNLENGLRKQFATLLPWKRRILNSLIACNGLLTRKKPRLALSRVLLKDVHEAFGGHLRSFLVGGAFTEPATLQFFQTLGIPVANGYGCTEACTAITVNSSQPFRPDTVGTAVPGMEIRIVGPDKEGVGEVAVRSRTVMSHYLEEPEATAETIVDGWLMTGDLGRLIHGGHLQLLGRKKNMIVTPEGKNIYPENIEAAFEGLPVKEFCVFAANYIWLRQTMLDEQLLLVVHLEPGRTLDEDLRGLIAGRNKRLLNYKRVSGCVVWPNDFPRTASLKIKRTQLAEDMRSTFAREDSVVPL